MCGLENLKPTGNVDKDFLQSMIVHHQGAIDMVNSIIKYTDNAEIKKNGRRRITKSTTWNRQYEKTFWQYKIK